MSLLHLKLMRDVVALRGQVFTIALLVAAGLAVFVSSLSTYDSLLDARSDYYQRGRFPQVFATVKRAPLTLVPRIAEIPGVAAVQPRIVHDVIIDLPDADVPVSARMVSLANGGEEQLSSLYLRSGVAPQPGETRFVAVNEAFAEATGIGAGRELRILLNGRVQTFGISGVALSPEFVYAVKSGMLIPDDRHFAVIWMGRRAAEAAFAMEGGFNDVVLSLAPGADENEVIAALDRLLDPYGGTGAVGRRDQSSHRFLEDELRQQKVMATTIPLVFFAVAAFLLNVVLGRLVAVQREQIAALKALGFPTAPIALHYLLFAGLLVALGSALGLLAGYGFGRSMIYSYQGFFRFPRLVFTMEWRVAALGVVLSMAAAASGTLAAVRSVVTLAPAVAMRGAVPLRFRRSLLERWLPTTRIAPSHMMVLRNLFGRPLRAAATTVGIALAVPMVVLGLFWRDAIDYMTMVQFGLVERGNTMLSFTQAVDDRVIGNLAREPGVLAVEGQRDVPARLRAGPRSYLTAVIGISPEAELRRPRNVALQPINITPEGLTLARPLAERLAVRVGDLVTVETLEGRRRRRDVEVAALTEEMIGMNAYMDITALDHLTGEERTVSAASLMVEQGAVAAFGRRLKTLPVVAAVAMKSATIASFLDKIAGIVLVSAAILTGFAVIIAFGVVYNGVRVGLQERAWQLASLRVLGFTRAEVSRLLFSETLVEVAIGLPLGLWLSGVIVRLIARLHSGETFQIPPVIGSQTLAIAAIVVVAAVGLSVFLVRRRIDRLDLVAVLKSRD